MPFLFARRVGLVHAHRLFLRPEPGQPAPPTGSLVASGLVFAAAYLATGIGRSRPLLVAAGLTVAWVTRILLRPAGDKLTAGLAFARAGRSSKPRSVHGRLLLSPAQVLGVPVWLPALCLHLSLLSRQIHLVFPRQLVD